MKENVFHMAATNVQQEREKQLQIWVVEIKVLGKNSIFILE
jgi:hypothetical protein